MDTLIYNPSQIVTVDTKAKNEKRGSDMNIVSPIKGVSIEIKNGKIEKFISTDKINLSKYDKVIDLSGRVILPGLVECHTHLVFAGSRYREFNLRLRGKSYEEIAMEGGGIISTVKSVRESSFEDLLSLSKQKVLHFIEQGITTLEIKSGYGLSFYDEIKILEVINELNNLFEIDIIPTFLGAHTFPPEYQNDRNKYLDMICNEMIPYISDNNLSSWCDGFCEATAFSSKQIETVLKTAIDNGMSIKLHTDQFNSIGGLELALDFGARSVDHLEVLKGDNIKKLAESKTTAVLLPGVSFSLKYSYAPAKELIMNNAILALATDYNPGSSHISSVGFIWGLAAFKMGMSIEEIISAYTINSAKALNMSNSIGSLEIGKNADFAVFSSEDYSELIYDFSNNLNVMTIKKGKVIYEK